MDSLSRPFLRYLLSNGRTHRLRFLVCHPLVLRFLHFTRLLPDGGQVGAAAHLEVLFIVNGSSTTRYASIGWLAVVVLPPQRITTLPSWVVTVTTTDW